jgi:hypothetical protein
MLLSFYKNNQSFGIPLPPALPKKICKQIMDLLCVHFIRDKGSLDSLWYPLDAFGFYHGMTDKKH